MKKKIASLLIVDDNEFDTLFTVKLLEKTGLFEKVYSVTDGAEALALFKNYEQSRKNYPDAFPPLLILLDINMPLMGGFDFLREYAKLGRGPDEAPSIIVMLSSSNFDRDHEQAMQNPLVKGYIIKPFTRERAIELAETFGA